MQQFTLTELWGHMGLFARLVVYVLGLMSLGSIIIMSTWPPSKAAMRSPPDGNEMNGHCAPVAETST